MSDEIDYIAVIIGWAVCLFGGGIILGVLIK